MRRSFKNCSTNTVSKSIQLSAFRSALSELHGKVKHQEAAISTISSTTFPLELPQASRLLGSVVGIEGSKVFPTVFESNEDVTKKWQPSPWVFERIQLILNKKTLSSNHPVEDIIDVIREDSKVGSQGMSKQRNIATSAGWRYNDKQWIQYQGVAELSFFGLSWTKARENVKCFSDLNVQELTAKDLEWLNDKPTQQSIAFRTPTPVHYHSLAVFDTTHTKELSSESADGHALLYSAASLVNQAVLHDVDEAQLAYSMMHNGRTWRFVAFQLNNLMIQHNVKTIANAAWIYEAELFHRNSESGKLVINPEPFLIVHDILQSSSP